VTQLRILLADDQALVRAGLRMILEAQPDIAVVDEAADGETAIQLTRRHRPDVVLMDVRMPGMDGLEATRRLLQPVPSGVSASPSGAAVSAGAPRIVILTTFDLDEYVYAALQAGASGFLLKDTSPERLVASVRMIATGDALLAPSVTRRLVERFAHTRQGADRDGSLATLTAREREVLTLVANGLSNAEIAQTLLVSEATVKTHVAAVLGKLGLRNRVQAVILAYESGLVSPGGAA
jgi:DNA-binding NarL/FixJ family response regulator